MLDPEDEYGELDIPYLDACSIILVISKDPKGFIQAYANDDRESFSPTDRILAELIDECLESTTQISHIARGIELLPDL